MYHDRDLEHPSPLPVSVGFLHDNSLPASSDPPAAASNEVLLREKDVRGGKFNRRYMSLPRLGFDDEV